MPRAKIEIKKTTGWEEVAELIGLAFGFDLPDDACGYFGEMFEPDRSVGAYVGDLLIGHTCIWSIDLRVPGGKAPTAGVSMVGVRPTHRRRGVLSMLTQHQLGDLHAEQREPIAALSASEAAIYGRYGYGLATDHVAVTLHRGTRLRPVDGVGDVRVEYADPAATRDLCGQLHDTTTTDRPGSFCFSSAWRAHNINDPASWRMGASPKRCVLADRGGDVTGYAYFRTRPDPNGVAGTVEVTRVHAVDLVSYAALWSFLLDQDLMMQTTHSAVALDDPLLNLLINPRSAAPIVQDGLWVRLVDVDRALAARSYTDPIDVVVEVTDELCPWNAGRWRLSADDSGATCEATTDSADLALDIRELGAVYLGRPSLLAQGSAGLVEERTTGALQHVSRAFAHDPRPHRDTTF